MADDTLGFIPDQEQPLTLGQRLSRYAAIANKKLAPMTAAAGAGGALGLAGGPFAELSVPAGAAGGLASYGIAHLLDLPAAAYNNLKPQAWPASPYPGAGFDDAVNGFTKKIGLNYGQDVVPQTTGERIAASTINAVGDAASGNALGGLLKGMASPGAQAVGEAFSPSVDIAASKSIGIPFASKIPGSVGNALSSVQIPVNPNVVAAASSGAASQVAQEIAPDNHVAPVLAGLIAPLATPALANVGKAAFRGTFDPTHTADMVRLGDDLGTSFSVGQATGAPLARFAEAVFGHLPGGNLILANRGNKQATAIGGRLLENADSLDPYATATSAGSAVNQGINKAANQGGVWRNEQNALYNNFRNSFDTEAPGSTSNYAAELAKATAPKMAGTAQGAALDAENVVKSGYAKNFNEDVAKGTHNWSFDYKKTLRQDIDDKINFGSSDPSLNEDQLRKLRTALTADMEADAKAAGPEAFAAWKKADAYTSQLNDKLDVLMPLIRSNKATPEGTFVSLTQPNGIKFGASKIGMALEGLPDETKKTFASAFIRERLGRANPGQQNAAGDAFNTETFLTNWSKMSPEAKKAIFSPLGDDFVSNMDKIANAASTRREGAKTLVNTSGTTSSLMTAGTVAGLSHGIALQNIPYIVQALTTAGIGAGGAALFTNPAFVRSLARNTKATPANLLAQFGIAGDQLKQSAGGNDHSDLGFVPDDHSDLGFVPDKPKSKAKRLLGE